MKKLLWIVLITVLSLASFANAQEAVTNDDGTASVAGQSNSGCHWVDNGWWDRGTDDEWYYTEYWECVPDTQDKTVVINDEEVSIAANNQCTQQNPCLAWGPVTVSGARAGAVIHGEFVLYQVDLDGGPITWGVRGDYSSFRWDVSGQSCGRCGFTVVGNRDNPELKIVWFGQAQSFKVALENIAVISNPDGTSLTPQQVVRQGIKDEAYTDMQKYRNYAELLKQMAPFIGDPNDGVLSPSNLTRKGLAFLGSKFLESMGDRAERVWRDPLVPCPGECEQPYEWVWSKVSSFDCDAEITNKTGIGSDNGLCDWLVYYWGYADGLLKGANVSIDRAESCSITSGVSCFEWQQQRVYQYLVPAGQGLIWLAQILDSFTDYMDEGGQYEAGNIFDAAAATLDSNGRVYMEGQ